MYAEFLISIIIIGTLGWAALVMIWVGLMSLPIFREKMYYKALEKVRKKQKRNEIEAEY